MALRASATSQYAVRLSSDLLDGPPFTICFQCLREGTVNTAGVFGLRNHQGSDDGYCLFYNYNNDGSSYAWEQGGGSYPSIGPFTLPTNTWHFIAISYAGTGANQTTVYRRAAGASTLTAVTGTFPTLSNGDGITQEVVLTQNYDLVNTFPGKIAALKQWNGVALTADELWNESQVFVPVRTANLHSWRPFADNTVAGSLIDHSGNGRNLTANGSLSIADGPPIAWRQGRRRIFLPIVGGGGATVDMDGLAGGRSSVQGALSVVRALSSRAAGQGRIVGAASVLRPMQGVISGRGQVNGSASITRALTGSAAGRASTQGATSIQRGLSGTVTGQSRTQASAAVLRRLSSAIAGRSNAVGDFATSAFTTLAGLIAGRSSVRGALSVIRELSARTGGASRASGAVNVLRELTAKVSGSSATQATISALRTLAGRAQGIGRAIGALLLSSDIEVITIVRSLLRASMASEPIRATGKIRIPIVVSAINMIAKNTTLKGYVIGDDTEIAFELTDWPAGVVLVKAYFTVKKSLKDADASAIIQREVTTSLSIEGQITANGSSGTATGHFLIRHQDTEWASVKPGVQYHFDIQPITDQATVQTPILGTISFVKGSTDAAS